MNKVYSSFFTQNPPARSVIAVSAMPGDTPVEIAVVAVRDLKQKKVITVASPAEPASNAIQSGTACTCQESSGWMRNRWCLKSPARKFRRS